MLLPLLLPLLPLSLLLPPLLLLGDFRSLFGIVNFGFTYKLCVQFSSKKQQCFFGMSQSILKYASSCKIGVEATTSLNVRFDCALACLAPNLISLFLHLFVQNSSTMQNEAGVLVDIYIPRKW